MAKRRCVNTNKRNQKERYGDENYCNVEKIKITTIKHYGVENAFQSEEIKEKSKQTCLKNFSVEFPTQNIEIFNKGLKTRFLIHQYKDTNLWYQGSYELDFIYKYLTLFPDLSRGPSIKYIFKNKNKVYHSDFFIPSLNLVIEIKSSWIIKLDDEIIEKQKATIANGFKYIMIVDKNYSEFNKLYLQL